MKVFISWSGLVSKKVAKNLKATLEEIFENQPFEAFVSDEDIPSGSDWYQIIKKELQNSDLGILCITKDNLNAPWINFEGGALSMQHKITNVIPLLINDDIDTTSSPFKNYHHVKLTSDYFKKMLKDIKKLGNLSNPTNKHIDLLSDKYFKDFFNTIKDLLSNIDKEYPENKISIYPSHVKRLKKNSIFIGAPMASLPEDEYILLRKEIIKIKDAIKKYCNFYSIHYPGEEILNPVDYDGEQKAIINNFKILKETEFFIFIYPEKIASSILTEIGYGIALSKKIIIFTKDRNVLPYMLKEADRVIDNIKIHTFTNYSEISSKIYRNGNAFFKF